MNSNLKAIILIILSSSYLISQTPDTLWTKTIGGINKDTGSSVKQTNDGGFIIAGTTNSFGAGDYDVYLIKTNEEGDTMWTRTYGGAFRDYGSEVQQTIDDGYIIIGATKSFNNNIDDLYLIKTDANGDILWTKVYGGLWGEVGSSIIQDSAGNYLATGYTMSFDPGNADVWVLKFNEFGDTLWTRRVGGDNTDYGVSIKRCENGDYIITGYTQSFSSNHDIYLIRINPYGDTTWTNHYGGEGLDFGEDVLELDGGEFIIAGYTTSYGTDDYDCYLVRVNAHGDTLWTKHYGGEYDDKAYAIQLFEDGIALAGYTHNAGSTERDALIIKTNFDGDVIWTKTIGGLYNDWGLDIYKTDDNGLILTGQFDKYGNGNHDVWLVRIDNLLMGVENEFWPIHYLLSQNYPNPFNPSTRISWQSPISGWQTLKVYDVLGNEVVTLVDENKPAGKYEVEFQSTIGIRRLASGVYFYRLYAGGFIETKKMILIR